MKSDLSPRLLGDVGGTNARFAWQAHVGASPTDIATYPCSQHASLLAAIQHYLAEHGKRMPHLCAIGIANPIGGDRVQMTNHHWSFSILELQAALGLEQLVVINDFTALALSLPGLAVADLRQVGPGTATPGAPLALLGPGTGLGVSGLLPTGTRGFTPISGEGGHVTLSAGDEREAAVVQWLRQHFGHASAERALSGPGLVNLYEASCALSAEAAQPLGPGDVIEQASNGADACCRMALDLFCAFLGGVAGNLALTLGARGGVYIGGGIVPRMMSELERSSFRARFEGKGRFRDYLSGIPTLVIDAAIPPALCGAARALDTAYA
jgi:glucokinase